MPTRKPTGRSVAFTAPGLSTQDADAVTSLLQNRLNSLNDLALTLKHIHWNVVGPHFIAVHEMLDPQVDAVREMVDDLAERIATLGASPVGTPGALCKERDWDDYSLGRADAMEHLGALSRDQAVPETVRASAQALLEAPMSQELVPLRPDLGPAQAAHTIVAHARQRVSPPASA